MITVKDMSKMSETSFLPSKEGLSNLKHRKLEEKRVSEPPEHEVKHHLTHPKKLLWSSREGR